MTDDTTLIDHYTQIEGVTPLDILLEKEKRRAIIEMLRFVMPLLDRKDRKVFWLFIKGEPFEMIARRMGMKKQSVSERLDRIPKKLEAHISPEQREYWMGFLISPQSEKVAGYPTSCGYPFEYLMHVDDKDLEDDEKNWGIRVGRRTYLSRWKCKLPEYFDECFEEGHKTHCPICTECHRKDYVKRLG